MTEHRRAFEGRLHHFNFLCMFSWKIGPNGGMMTTPLFPIPFARSRRGTTSAGTAFFANGLFLRHGVLLSWPIPWVWLKSTSKHIQTGRYQFAAWLLACVGVLCKQWASQCFGLAPFACWCTKEIILFSLLLIKYKSWLQVLVWLSFSSIDRTGIMDLPWCIIHEQCSLVDIGAMVS